MANSNAAVAAPPRARAFDPVTLDLLNEAVSGLRDLIVDLPGAWVAKGTLELVEVGDEGGLGMDLGTLHITTNDREEVHINFLPAMRNL